MGAGISGANDQKDIDKDRVELEFLSDLEDIRRREFEQQSIQGTAKAFSENAGVLHSGGSTAQGFLNTMATQFSKEIKFMRDYAYEARSLGNRAATLKHRAGIMNSLSEGVNSMGAGMT